MLFPARSHWYLNAVPDVHVPGFAVSVFPTLTAPTIVGVFATSVALATGFVTAETFDAPL